MEHKSRKKVLWDVTNINGGVYKVLWEHEARISKVRMERRRLGGTLYLWYEKCAHEIFVASILIK